MRLVGGLAEWWGDLKKIYGTPEVRGIEKIFDLTIRALKITALSEVLQICFWGRRYQVPTWFVDVYVVAATILLVA
jgi:hypothetical protein